jgi:hypothetical protein
MDIPQTPKVQTLYATPSCCSLLGRAELAHRHRRDRSKFLLLERFISFVKLAMVIFLESEGIPAIFHEMGLR